MLTAVVVAFNSYRLTILRIEMDLQRSDDRMIESEVKSLREWRQMTQSNRFTSAHGAQLRNDMDTNIAAIVQRLDALERDANDRK
jgi:UDP-N-acetylenolpyruvoylglucosamine reductase